MTYYARGALITDVQAPHSEWSAFGIYGDANAYWLAREPSFTESQLEELDLEYIPEHALPFAHSHDGVYRPGNRRPDPAAGLANRHRNPSSVRRPGRGRPTLVGRVYGHRRTGNY